MIVHRGRVAAVAGERVHVAEHIEVLEPDHPERRFVAALCVDSHAVDTGRTARRVYCPVEAAAFARALLRPAREFAASRELGDPQLAERFGAPLDHVTLRRAELAE